MLFTLTRSATQKGETPLVVSPNQSPLGLDFPLRALIEALGYFALCGGRGGLRALHRVNFLKKVQSKTSARGLCEHSAIGVCGREFLLYYPEISERHVAALGAPPWRKKGQNRHEKGSL